METDTPTKDSNSRCASAPRVKYTNPLHIFFNIRFITVHCRSLATPMPPKKTTVYLAHNESHLTCVMQLNYGLDQLWSADFGAFIQNSYQDAYVLRRRGWQLNILQILTVLQLIQLICAGEWCTNARALVYLADKWPVT